MRLCSGQGLVLLAALGVAVLAGMFLAKRMVGPIQALRAGAARIGSGDLAQHIAIKTGDELEALADQFNDMASRLQESYTGLEEKVELRTGNCVPPWSRTPGCSRRSKRRKQLEAANLRMRAELDFVGQMQQLVLPTRTNSPPLTASTLLRSWNRRTKSAATTTMSCTPMASSPSALAMSPAMALRAAC